MTTASNAVVARPSFAREVAVYVGRVRSFTRRDWIVYVAWVGLMTGLAADTGGFLIYGAMHGVHFPADAWLVPVGALAFTFAIAVDTVGHLTIYRQEIARAEELVHHVTIVAGVASCVFLCAAYGQRAVFTIPALVATVLSFVYSLVDEAFHWRRYASATSDRVEMWSHVLILTGHGTMMLAWWHWFLLGYPGVADTLNAWQAA